MIAIQAEKIKKCYGQRTVVRSATLSIAEGQRVALIGRSGCGKSTLLRTIVGLDTPDSGRVYLLGQPVVGLPLPSGVAYLTQRPVLLPWLDALSNALLPLALQRKPTPVDIASTRELFALFELREAEAVHPQNLSGGMRQRVALIQALASNPKILILDEPFNALDDITRRLVLIELAKWMANRKCTLLMVSHSFEDAAYLCSRVVIWSARTRDYPEGDLVDIGELPAFNPAHSLPDFTAESLDTRKRHLFELYVSIDSGTTLGL